MKLSQYTASILAVLFAGPVFASAGAWTPLSGDWKIEAETLSELSDGSDSGNRPLWIAGGAPGDSLAATVTTLDGVGDLYLAIGWKNRDNFCALRYSDPHRKLELLKVENGRETILASTENAGKASPQKEPLPLSLAFRGGILIGKAGDTVITAFAGKLPGSGAGAFGTRYRQGIFRPELIPMNDSAPQPPSAEKVTIVRDGWRKVFEQNEKNVQLSFTATPLPGAPESELVVHLADAIPDMVIPLPAKGGAKTFTVDFPAGKLRPGNYPVTLRAVTKENPENRTVGLWEELLTVAPDRNPERYEMILWDGIDSWPELARLGFTASSAPFFFTSKYAAEKEKHVDSVVAAVRRAEAGLPFGVSTLLKIDTRRNWDKKQYADWMMKDAKGELQLSGDICQNHPEFRKTAAESVESLGEALADTRSIGYLLFDSETENEERKLYQCFHPACLERAAKAGFQEIPAHLNRTWGMVGVSLVPVAKKLAPSGVIPDSTPEGDFIRWWWLEGSGYVDARAEAAGILKRHLPEAKSFHDPILRNPPYAGRDRDMDFVSHWTYTNPSPLALLENIDEMRAAAGYSKPVVPNIQLFWYTNEVIGKLENAADRAKQAQEAAAVAEARDAVHFGRFVTISPDHLREAVWLAMARPLSALMLDGGSAISVTPGTYAATNPDTVEALAEISDTLVKPYGPMLKGMTGSPARVAVLQSAASTLFGRTGNFGNANKRFADVYNTILLAQLQPEILYDDSIERLDRYDVLIVADTEIIPEQVFRRIEAFISAGKPVILDQAAGLKLSGSTAFPFPDTAKLGPAEQQQSWNTAGKELKKLLESKGFRYDVSSPSGDVILSTRLGDGDRAIFVVNDARCAGKYVGQYGKVLDSGVPRKVRIDFAPGMLKGKETVYDVLSRRKLDPSGAELFLPAGGGRLLYVAESPITGIEVAPASPAVKRGETIKIRLKFTSVAGLRGTQAVSLEIRDSRGRLDARSGSYAAKNGELDVTLPVALNDAAGFWQVKARDLIAGFSAEAAFEVK